MADSLYRFLLLCLFPVLSGNLHSLALASFLHIPYQQHSISQLFPVSLTCVSSITSLSLILTVLLPSQEDHCAYTELNRILQGNLLTLPSFRISYANHVLPCKGTYAQVRALGGSHLGEEGRDASAFRILFLLTLIFVFVHLNQ